MRTNEILPLNFLGQRKLKSESTRCLPVKVHYGICTNGLYTLYIFFRIGMRFENNLNTIVICVILCVFGENFITNSACVAKISIFA